VDELELPVLGERLRVGGESGGVPAVVSRELSREVRGGGSIAERSWGTRKGGRGRVSVGVVSARSVCEDVPRYFGLSAPYQVESDDEAGLALTVRLMVVVWKGGWVSGGGG